MLDFESISYKDEMDQGERELISNVAGAYCIDDEACPLDRGVSLTFNECKETDTLAALAGFGNITKTLTVVDGFDRVDYTCTAGVAVELLFDVPSLCGGGGAQVIGQLFPLVKLFNSTGAEKTINGKSTVRGSYTAQGKKNARLWENFATTLPDEFAHWQPWKSAIGTGTQYYLRRVFNTPADTPKSCDLRAIVDAA